MNRFQEVQLTFRLNGSAPCICHTSQWVRPFRFSSNKSCTYRTLLSITDFALMEPRRDEMASLRLQLTSKRPIFYYLRILPYKHSVRSPKTPFSNQPQVPYLVATTNRAWQRWRPSPDTPIQAPPFQVITFLHLSTKALKLPRPQFIQPRKFSLPFWPQDIVGSYILARSVTNLKRLKTDWTTRDQAIQYPKKTNRRTDKTGIHRHIHYLKQRRLDRKQNIKRVLVIILGKKC